MATDRYIIRVVTKQGQDCWLGQRVYTSRELAQVVKNNLVDSGRYQSVRIVLAEQKHIDSALSTQE